MSYTPHGTLSSATLGNDAIYSYGYNSRLQPSSINVTRNGTVLEKLEYKYGKVNLSDGTVDETKNNGQIGRIESWIGTQKQWQQRFVYDTLGRLVTSGEYRGDNSQQTYQLNFNYDVFANRYQYQAANSGNPSSLNQKWVEPTDIDKATNRFTSGVTYDAAGNVTADPRFRNLEYQYDANGRMKQSSQPNGVSPVKAIFDGAGQRVATKFNGALAIMVYDVMGKLVAEYGQTAPATASIHYIMADHQGSTRLVTDPFGTVYSRHDYQPFGEEINAGVGMRTTDQKFDTADNVRLKYTGMETDDATGMSHTTWRKYDGQSGRWTSPDPYGGSMTIVDPQTFNRYTYVNNDPVNLTDPTGLMFWRAEYGWNRIGWSFANTHPYGGSGTRVSGHIFSGLLRNNSVRFKMPTWDKLSSEQQRLFITYFENNHFKPIGDPAYLTAAAYWNLSAAAANLGGGLTSLLGYQLLSGDQLATFIGVTSAWEHSGVIGAVAKIDAIEKDNKKDKGFRVYGTFADGGAAIVKGKGHKIDGHNSTGPDGTKYLSDHSWRERDGPLESPSWQFTMNFNDTKFDADVDYNGYMSLFKHGRHFNSDILHGEYLEKHIQSYGPVPIFRVN